MNTVRSVRNKHKLPRTEIHVVKTNLTQQRKNPSLLMATNHTTPHQHALHQRQVSEGRLQSEKRGVEAKREARGEISAVVHGEYVPLLQSCTCVCVCVCVGASRTAPLLCTLLSSNRGASAIDRGAGRAPPIPRLANRGPARWKECVARDAFTSLSFLSTLSSALLDHFLGPVCPLAPIPTHTPYSVSPWAIPHHFR